VKFLMCPNISVNFLGQCVRTFIDATHHGNLSRLINHSCDPNLFPVVLRYGRVLPVLALFTKRDIQTGRSLAFREFITLGFRRRIQLRLREDDRRSGRDNAIQTV
jgi:hypothetical protein